MKPKYKVDDRINFIFAGSLHDCVITAIDKTSTHIIYRATDGKYKYSVKQEDVLIEK